LPKTKLPAKTAIKALFVLSSLSQGLSQRLSYSIPTVVVSLRRAIRLVPIEKREIGRHIVDLLGRSRLIRSACRRDETRSTRTLFRVAGGVTDPGGLKVTVVGHNALRDGINILTVKDVPAYATPLVHSGVGEIGAAVVEVLEALLWEAVDLVFRFIVPYRDAAGGVAPLDCGWNVVDADMVLGAVLENLD
jgi:hypothetical protein